MPPYNYDLVRVRNRFSEDPIVIAHLGNEKASTTIASTVSIGDTLINVTNSTGMSIGDSFFIIDYERFIVEQFMILGISSNQITVDTPSGNEFTSGIFVGSSNVNLAVNGSSTPVKFNLKTGLEDVPMTLELTRIMITILTSSGGGINDFGDISNGLTKGIYLRVKNSNTRTIFNIKKNLEFAQIAYDLTSFQALPFSNEGYSCRLTFARMNGALILPKNEDLELWVQDDLSSLVNFSAIVEGIIVL